MNANFIGQQALCADKRSLKRAKFKNERIQYPVNSAREQRANRRTNKKKEQTLGCFILFTILMKSIKEAYSDQINHKN